MTAPVKLRTRPPAVGRVPAILLVCLLAGISPGALGAVIEVDTLDDVVDANDGVCSLREAIDNANDDAQTRADCEAGTGEDTIRFAQTQDLFDAVSGGESLALSGSELAVNDAGDTLGEPLTIDGAIADPSSSDDPPPEVTVTIDGGGSGESDVSACTIEDSRVGRILTVDTPTTLTSLTLTNGCVEDDGGIIFNASALTLAGVNVSNGSALEVAEAGGRGGAIFNDDGATLVIDEGSQIANSFASRRGGGIANVSMNTIACPVTVVPDSDCTISLDGTTLSGNVAGFDDTGEGGSGMLLLGHGGALHNAGGTVAGRSVTLNENAAIASGGGIWNSETGTIELLSATLQSNQALALNDTDPVRGGAAIFNDGGTLNIEFAAFSGNQTLHNVSVGDAPVPVHGGGIASTGGAITLDTVAMTQNQVGRAASQTQPGSEEEEPEPLPAIPGLGGALYVADGTLAVHDSTLIQNTAQTGGGAIWSEVGAAVDAEPALAIVRSTAQGNQVRDNGQGGGLHNGGSAGIDDSRFYANAVGGENGTGGAVFNAGSLDIADTEIGRNNAAFGGGIDNAGELTLTRVFLGATQTESRNRAGADGGGLRNRSGGIATVENSTIAFNDAGAGDLGDNSGGGIWNAGTLSVTNSTFSNNRALNGGAGGGLFQAGGSGNLRFTTLIADSGGGVATAGGTVTAESSLVTGAAGGSVGADTFSLINPSSAGVDGLKLFGGATPTRPLRAGSAAVDAGEQSNCDSVGNLDQRGAARPPDGSGNGSACDTGSFERTDDPVLKVDRNGPEQISVQSQIGGDLAVLAFSIANNGDDNVTVGGFNVRPLFNGGIEALRQLVRNDPEVAGQLQFDIVLDDGAGENAGNGLLDDDETTVVGTGDTAGQEFLFDSGAGRSFAAGENEDFLVVLRLPEAETETAGLFSLQPLFAGGLLIGLLGLVRIRELRRRVQWLLVIGLLTAGLAACSESTGIDDLQPPPQPVPDPSLQGQLRFKLFQLESTTVAGEIVIGEGLPVFGPAISVR